MQRIRPAAPPSLDPQASEVQRLDQRHEAHSEMLQFLECRQQIRYRPAPAVQPPHQHHIDLATACGLQQFLTSFSLGRTGADLTYVHGNGPAPPGSILMARFCMGSVR